MPGPVKLTRRDALAALAASGLAAGVAVERLADGARDTVGEPVPHDPADLSTTGGAFGDHERETLVALAHVVYPSAVTGVEAFVQTYFDRRTDQRPARATQIAEVIAQLDDLGTDWHGGPVIELDSMTREQLLREVGADTAVADPTGTTAERVRHFLVNELLFALYTSPAGGRLAGIENPQGHPGGLASYQRGPDG